MQRQFDLSGRGIGLTGGGGHLGSAIAIGLAQANAIVVIGGRNLETLEHVVAQAEMLQVPGRVLAHQMDIRQPETVKSMLDCIEREAGEVYGWINNAYAGTTGTLLDVTQDQVDRTMDIGFTAVLSATQAAVRRMMPHRRGVIINVGSMYGIVSPQPAVYVDAPEFHNPPQYGAAKAAILQLTRYAACHLGPLGIRVNSLSPGAFPSREVQASSETFVTALSDRIPLGRVGKPEELAGAAIFLMSDASSYMTGVNLVIDGGWTAW